MNDTEPKHAAETPNRIIPSPAARAWIYRIITALAAIAVIYGLVTPEQSTAWLEVAGAALGIISSGLALANTPR
jgi:hypothetical protein